jgi:cytochrome c-type biogenesis protein CcmH
MASTFMNINRRFPAILFSVVLIAIACTSVETIPTAEIAAQEINKTVMCPICPGESIDQSQHPLAVDMRGIVNEKLEQGWTGGQIRDFFVERYGPSVLLEPPREGLNWLVWIVPPVGVAVGGIALYLVLRMTVRSNTRRRESPVDEIELTANERDHYFERIEAALAFDTGDSRQLEVTDHSEGQGEPVDR